MAGMLRVKHMVSMETLMASIQRCSDKLAKHIHTTDLGEQAI